MRSAALTTDGFVDGGTPSWGEFAGARDPLLAAATALVGTRNPRLRRLERSSLAALVVAHVALGEDAADLLVVAVEDGSAAADRAYWETARARGGVEASPVLFASTLPSVVAGEIAMTFGLRGACLVLAGRGAFERACDTAPSLPGPRLDVRVRGWDSGAARAEASAVWRQRVEIPGRRRAYVGGAMTTQAPATSSNAVPTPHDRLRSELVLLICESMRRDPVDPATVSDATPCVGGPLLHDSLDVLEFIVTLDRVYGASLRDGDAGRAALADLGALTRYVSEHRTR